MKQLNLKLDRTSFNHVWNHKKQFLIFHVKDSIFEGDIFIISEMFPDVLTFSGYTVTVRVDFIFQDVFGLLPDYRIFAFEIIGTTRPSFNNICKSVEITGYNPF